MTTTTDPTKPREQLQEAFEKLYQQHAPLVVAYCWQFRSQLAAHNHDPEDVAQIVWSKVHTHLEKGGDAGERFPGWLRRVVKNQVIDICRRRHADESLALSNEVVVDMTAVSPVAELVDAERRNRLFECLRKLRENHPKRGEVARWKLNVESVQTICKSLELTRARVDKLWFEAKKFLQSCVDQES